MKSEKTEKRSAMWTFTHLFPNLHPNGNLRTMNLARRVTYVPLIGICFFLMLSSSCKNFIDDLYVEAVNLMNDMHADGVDNVIYLG